MRHKRGQNVETENCITIKHLIETIELSNAFSVVNFRMANNLIQNQIRKKTVPKI